MSPARPFVPPACYSSSLFYSPLYEHTRTSAKQRGRRRAPRGARRPAQHRWRIGSFGFPVPRGWYHSHKPVSQYSRHTRRHDEQQTERLHTARSTTLEAAPSPCSSSPHHRPPRKSALQPASPPGARHGRAPQWHAQTSRITCTHTRARAALVHHTHTARTREHAHVRPARRRATPQPPPNRAASAAAPRAAKPRSRTRGAAAHTRAHATRPHVTRTRAPNTPSALPETRLLSACDHARAATAASHDHTPVPYARPTPRTAHQRPNPGGTHHHCASTAHHHPPLDAPSHHTE